MVDPLPMEEPTPVRISEQYPSAAALIRKWESVDQSGDPHLIPYQDSGGNWTVGYGQLIDSDSKDIERTPEWAEANFDNQIEVALEDVRKLEAKLPKGMRFTHNEIEGLIPILQNVGYTKITNQGTNAMKALQDGDKERFAFELFDAEQGFTKGANEDGDKAVLEGLVTRRGEEAALFAGGHHTGGMVQRNPYPYNPRPI
jgi:GH24 family phage-related lysozyme (muramidase)